MSLVNPLNRWWNRKPVRRGLAWACWALAAITVAAGAAGTAIELDVTTSLSAPPWLIPVGLVGGMVGLLGGMFLLMIGREGEDVDARIITHPLGVLFFIMGAVPTGYALAAGAPVDLTFLFFAILSVIELVVAEILIRRAAANKRIRQAVSRGGVRTRGTVVRSTTYEQDYTTVSRVTVKFTDGDGNERWATGTLVGKVSAGRGVAVRYLPSALGSRAGVVIEPH